MEDLSARYPSRLTPTSQEGGGMVYDNSPAMTAPGSKPVTPMLTPQGNQLPLAVPELIPSPEEPVPVSGQASRTEGNPAPGSNRSGGGWQNTDDKPATGGWRNV